MKQSTIKARRHFYEDRFNRYMAIGKHLGFGNIIITGYSTIHQSYNELTDTGIIISRNQSGEVITIFAASVEKVKIIYKDAGQKVPNWLLKKVIMNEKKGLVKQINNIKD